MELHILSNWFGNPVHVTLLSILVFLLTYNYFLKRKPTPKKVLPNPKCSRLALCYSTVVGMYKKKRYKIEYILGGILQVVCGLCQTYDRERIFQLHVSMKPFVFIFKPEKAEIILTNSVQIDKAKEYKFMHPWLGTGLLTSGGKKWRYRRKLLTPSFHFRILDDFLYVFNEQSKILISKLQNIPESTFIDIVPLLTSCTLDIISETAMGVSINAQSGGCSEYVEAIHEIGNTFLVRILRPWLYYDFIFNMTPSGKKFQRHLKIAHSFTRKVIKEKKEELMKQEKEDKGDKLNTLNEKKRTAFLEMLLKLHLNDPSFTEEDIREEVDTFMFAGHDTTAITISFALYLVGLDDKVQRLVHEELDEIFDGDHDREITKDDLLRMKYLECVIKETLRVYPAVAFFAREITESFEMEEYTIEKGTFCLVIPMVLHRDPKYFPNPEKFDPKRFFPENVADRHPYAYIPFSAGPRNCIGQRYALREAKAVLANIFRKFTVRSKDPRDRIRILPNIVISNIDPINLYFTPRCPK